MEYGTLKTLSQEEVELYCHLILYADLIIYLLVINWMGKEQA